MLPIVAHEVQIRKSNVSCENLRRKQQGQGDPLQSLGLISRSDGLCPYRKPILKQPSSFNINTRGVVQELDRNHGGIRSTSSSSYLTEHTRSHMILMAGGQEAD